MPVEMPVRQAPVPAGHRRGQPGQWEQSEETLTIPALEGLGEEAVQEPGEEAPASGATGGSQVWDGWDVSFPPLRPSGGVRGRGGSAAGGEGLDVGGDGWSRDEAGNPGRTDNTAQAGVGRPRRVLPSPEALRR